METTQHYSQGLLPQPTKVVIKWRFIKIWEDSLTKERSFDELYQFSVDSSLLFLGDEPYIGMNVTFPILDKERGYNFFRETYTVVHKNMLIEPGPLQTLYKEVVFICEKKVGSINEILWSE